MEVQCARGGLFHQYVTPLRLGAGRRRISFCYDDGENGLSITVPLEPVHCIAFLLPYNSYRRGLEHEDMKLYTKTGDAGMTGLFGGDRVHKDDVRVVAYGEIDELNGVLGVVGSSSADAELRERLTEIQAVLFMLGAELATPDPGKAPSAVTGKHVAALEQLIDLDDAALPALRTFILPGGSPTAAGLHHARTVCRRAERAVVRLSRSASVRPEIKAYLNRLSDLLFVMARRVNQREQIPEIPWTPPARPRSGCDSSA